MAEQFKDRPRLPEFAVPERYDLKLTPDLIACKFSGSVKISVAVKSATKFLVLNAAELSVEPDSVIYRYSNKDFKAVHVEVFEADEILVVEFAESLDIGEGILSIAFDGTLDSMKGFCTSVYQHNGETKNMAVTQFKPANARRCFPCWDEPACKAKFKITLEVLSEVVALSNMPVVEQNSSGNTKTVYYQESPVISTYLVAVVIGLFDYVAGHTSNGIPVRVYCQVGKTGQAKFALEVAIKTLEFFTKFFGRPYSLPKLDMVAVPNFAAGAEESYGLVTYHETALLFDDKNSAASKKQRVATVVARQLAHQWFGNLVTMEWWTDLWLNEGFATWASYWATDSIFPHWQIWTQFLLESTDGLRLDALAESHPIEVDIKNVAEIDEIFDVIRYSKGASVIRMLQSYLGPQWFQKALASYIRKYAYSNAKTENLWAVLEEESNEPVIELMNLWTKQKGYPLVSVKIKDQKLEFHQSNFLLSGSPGDVKWTVPITIRHGSCGVHKRCRLKEKSGSVDLKELLGPSDLQINSWIKINMEQAGFYRVKYDEELYTKLRSAIQSKQLSTMDRYGILDDSFALSMGCQQPLKSLLTLMSAYGEEPEYIVLSNLISVIYEVSRIVADVNPQLHGDIKLFFVELLKNLAERLGWDPKQEESHLDAMLRGKLLPALASLGHDGTINEANKRFEKFIEDRETTLLPPDLRRAVYVAVMQHASSSNRGGYDNLLKVYRETEVSQEKTRIIGSLSSCRDPVLIREFLNFLLSSEAREEDVKLVGLHVCVEGREIAWEWLQENWDRLFQTYSDGYLITRFISDVVSLFSSTAMIAEVKEFLARKNIPLTGRTLKRSIERAFINAKWVDSIRLEVPSIGDAVKELLH